MHLHDLPLPRKSAPKFHLGKMVATTNALAALRHEEIVAALAHHIIGDWGDVNEHDRAQNDRALLDGSRLLSVYVTASNVKFWVITESDRSVTTVLLPEDY